MNVSFSGVEKGSYILTLISNSGQIVMSKTINVQYNYGIQNILLPTGLQKGIYLLRITGQNSTKATSIIKQ